MPILQDEKLYFAPDINSANIIGHIYNSTTKQNGYAVRKGAKSKFKSGAGFRQKVLCRKGRLYVAPQKKVNKSLTTTEMPTMKDDQCTNWFPIFFDETANRFFVRKHGGCCWQHCRHCPEHPDLIVDGKRDVPEDKLKTAKSMLERHIPTSMVKEWLHLETGVNLPTNSIKAIRHSVMISKFSSVDDSNSNATAAQKLLAMLEKEEGTEFCYLSATYDLAKDSVTVTKTRQSKKGKSAEDIKILDDEAKDHVKNVIKGLGLGNGQILLAVAWITKESKKYHKKYPFLLGQDGTFRTNAEKRALERLVSKSLNNNNLPIVNSFTPSRARWVYDWLWGDAYPYLLDLLYLVLTELILYDQDEQNIGASESQLSMNEDISKYGDAKRRICKWHKV